MKGRRSLRREMLLPFAPRETRALSLAAHMTLLALEKGEGNADHVVRLAEVICRTGLMGQLSGNEIDGALLAQAESVMGRLVQGTDEAQRCALDPKNAAVLARMLVIHDRLLESVPRRWFFEAQERLARETNAIARALTSGASGWLQDKGVQDCVSMPAAAQIPMQCGLGEGMVTVSR